MWAILMIIGAVAFVMILFSESQERINSPVTEENPSSMPKYELLDNDAPYRHYHDPHYNRGPIFSPDRRHIWDGEKWVRNEGGFGGGLLIGLLIAAVLYYLMHH